MRLIDAHLLMEKLQRTTAASVGERAFGLCVAQKIVETMPTITPIDEAFSTAVDKYGDNTFSVSVISSKGEKIDFERVKRGEWIFNRKNTQTGANIFRCSLCNYESQVFTCGIKYPAFDKFCGNCGAKMKGGEMK